MSAQCGALRVQKRLFLEFPTFTYYSTYFTLIYSLKHYLKSIISKHYFKTQNSNIASI